LTEEFEWMDAWMDGCMMNEYFIYQNRYNAVKTVKSRTLGDRRLAPDAIPGQCRDPDIAGGGAPKTSQNGRRSATGEAQWPISPWTTGRGIAASPYRTVVDNQSTSPVDGCVKRWTWPDDRPT